MCIFFSDDLSKSREKLHWFQKKFPPKIFMCRVELFSITSNDGRM